MKRVLDATCGARMMWFNKKHDDVVYMDKRTETHILCDGRTLSICPDVESDFTSMPFESDSFSLVVFDPPHLKNLGTKSWMCKKYGVLTSDWRNVIRDGFNECFRVLKKDGVLVFKWNEDQIKVSEVLSCTDQKPLFGHPTGRSGKTIWVTFMK